MRDIESILARLEKGETGRGMDGLIFRVQHADRPEADWCEFEQGDADVWYLRDAEDDVAWFAPPAYTTSLDSALSLVPEGWGNRTIGIHRDWAEAILGLPGQREAYGKASTAPLALCIAALKAGAAS